MVDEPEVLEIPCGSVFPKKPTPGALGVLAPANRFEELEELQREAASRDWEVRGIVSDHIPLSGLGALTRPPQHRLFLNESPLTIWLHRGGDRAVFFDLIGDNPQKKLEYVAVKVRTRLPSEALFARTGTPEPAARCSWSRSGDATSIPETRPDVSP